MPNDSVVPIVALTTEDNPYDPIDEFEEWNRYDLAQGYGTCAYIGRIARTSDELSDQENYEEINRAIDEILSFNLEGNYKKVVKYDANDKSFL